MRKLLLLMMVGAGVGTGATLYQGVEPGAGDMLGGVLGTRREAEFAMEAEPLLHRAEGTIKIGSYCVENVTAAALQDGAIAAACMEIVGRFDVLALQGIRSESQDWLPRLIEGINAGGRQLDYVIGPRVGRGEKEQYAFVFDRETIVIDRGAVYTVEDSDDLLAREPLVAAFRAKRVAAEEAFTFTLINVRVERSDAEAELEVLAEVFRAVRDDGRNEDDVILVGALYRDEFSWGGLGRVSNLQAAISGVATNVEGTETWDHVTFQRHATREFREGAGVVDLRSELGASGRELLELSSHLPVWAEFDVREAGRAAGWAAR